LLDSVLAALGCGKYYKNKSKKDKVSFKIKKEKESSEWIDWDDALEELDDKN